MPDRRPYTKDAKPELFDSGNGSKKLFCENASSYYPNEAANAKSDITSKIDSFKEEINDKFGDLTIKVAEMKKHFGTEFISINGEGLGFVDEGTFTNVKGQIDTELETIANDLETFFSDCAANESEIRVFLHTLHNNYVEYKNKVEKRDKLLQQRNFHRDDEEAVEYYDDRIDKLNEEIREYKRIDDPLDYGAWQKK